VETYGLNGYARLPLWESTHLLVPLAYSSHWIITCGFFPVALQLIRTKMKYSLQRMETASIKAFTFIELSLSMAGMGLNKVKNLADLTF